MRLEHMIKMSKHLELKREKSKSTVVIGKLNSSIDKILELLQLFLISHLSLLYFPVFRVIEIGTMMGVKRTGCYVAHQAHTRKQFFSSSLAEPVESVHVMTISQVLPG